MIIIRVDISFDEPRLSNLMFANIGVDHFSWPLVVK